VDLKVVSITPLLLALFIYALSIKCYQIISDATVLLLALSITIKLPVTCPPPAVPVNYAHSVVWAS
jgi:hypothetical protein